MTRNRTLSPHNLCREPFLRCARASMQRWRRRRSKGRDSRFVCAVCASCWWEVVLWEFVLQARLFERSCSRDTVLRSQYIQTLSRVPTSVDLPIYTSHSQHIPSYSPRPNPNLPTYTPYIQLHPRVPSASISSHAPLPQSQYIHLSSSPSLLTLCVDIAFAALCVIFQEGYLWRETSVKRVSCV